MKYEDCIAVPAVRSYSHG